MKPELLRRIIFVFLFAVCLMAGAVLAQQRVVMTTSAGAEVATSTTSELTHGATAPTWTAVVGQTQMARGSATAPTPVTADQPVAPWAALDGSRASWMVAEPSGGATPGNYISAATNNSTNLKSTAGQIYSITVVNVTASLKYIRLYNLSSAPTCTSATGIVFYTPIPGSTTNPVPVQLTFPVGKTFTTGIGWCITGGAGTTDNTSTAAGDVVLNYDYK